MHHKRRRPKNRRAGCLYCKPHKVNGYTTLVHIKGGPKGKVKADEVER
jgi:hypothetical protein